MLHSVFANVGAGRSVVVHAFDGGIPDGDKWLIDESCRGGRLDSVGADEGIGFPECRSGDGCPSARTKLLWQSAFRRIYRRYLA
jgi:hypothetical protein